ncbi:hypothetical protein GCM10020001_091480 [Nonomuraea salmonea]
MALAATGSTREKLSFTRRGFNDMKTTPPLDRKRIPVSPFTSLTFRVVSAGPLPGMSVRSKSSLTPAMTRHNRFPQYGAKENYQ